MIALNGLGGMPLSGEAEDYVGEHLLSFGVDVARAFYEDHFIGFRMACVGVDQLDKCFRFAIRKPIITYSSDTTGCKLVIMDIGIAAYATLGRCKILPGGGADKAVFRYKFTGLEFLK